MKNLDLATLGVEEMNETELQVVDGGWLWQSVAFALVWDYINDPGDCNQSMADGWRDGRR